jgi:hypothetical protein
VTKQADSGRTPVAYFHIVGASGKNLGWVGFCEAINQAMVPVFLHPGGPEAAEERALTDPPKVMSVYNGDGYVPYDWMRLAMTGERDLFVIDAMRLAAEKAKVAQGESQTKAEDQ